MNERTAASDSKTPSAITRRAFLGTAAAAGCMAATAGFAAKESRRPFFAGHDLPLGLQLYTLGDAPYRDLDGTLEAVANIGYRSVETVGFMNRAPSELRTALARAGLSCPSVFASLQPDGSGGPTLAGDIGKLAADVHRIGAKYVIVPIFNLPPPPHIGGQRKGEDDFQFASRAAREMTADDWRHIAAQMSEKGAALKREGLKLACHNYNVEFARCGSKTGYDLLLENTDPDTVWFEMDVGWVVAAGADPIPLLRAHRGRFRLLHVKDLKTSTAPTLAFKMDPANVGSGSIDWKTVLPAAYDAGVRYFYVEQEPPFAGPRMDAVRADYEYLVRL